MGTTRGPAIEAGQTGHLSHGSPSGSNLEDRPKLGQMPPGQASTGKRPSRRVVTLYGSPECHLCEVAKMKLARVRRFIPFELHEVDIRQDAALLARYGEVIPVVAIDGKDALVSKVTEFRLLLALR